MKRINTSKAPSAIGPYSQAFVAGDFMFTSGQGGINPENGKVVEGGIEAQTEQTMKNLNALFNEAGADFTKAVKTTCFLANMSDFTAFNAVYAKYFTEKPPRTCVAVKELSLGILCEVEVVLYLGK